MLDKTFSRLISFLITTGLFVYTWYIYKRDFPVSKMILDIKSVHSLMVYFLPVVLSILWSLLKKRYLWLLGVISFIACAIFMNSGLPDFVPEILLPDFLPYLLYIVISYISCVIAIFMRRGEMLDLDFGSTTSSYIDPCPNGQCY